MLAGLRLNCLLAPLIVAIVATAFIVRGHRASIERAQAAELAGLSATIVALAARVERAGDAADLAALRGADTRWSAIGLVAIGADAGELRASDGRLATDIADLPPRVVDGIGGPQGWAEPTGALRAVAPVHMGGRTLVLLGEATSAIRSGWADAASSCAILIVVAGLLSWYLARRIWRPVEALQRAAEDALAGRPPAGVTVESSETATARSAVLQLAESYRSQMLPVREREERP